MTASGHHGVLRQVSYRLVGIKTRTLYDEQTSWGHHHKDRQAA